MSEYNYCRKVDFMKGELVPATSDEKIQGMRMKMEKPFNPSLISETPVSTFKDNASTLDIVLDARQKRRVFLSSTHMPLAESLVEKWALEDYGMEGSFGYFFRYEMGDLCLYQLKESGESNPISDATLLTTVDWDVLSMSMHDFLLCDPSAVGKRVKSKGSLVTFPTTNELKEWRILFILRTHPRQAMRTHSLLQSQPISFENTPPLQLTL